jgi:dihydrofolate synthase/folylpolyglutamate synthase
VSAGAGSERLGAALARLYALAPGGMKPGLSAMEEACREHGDLASAFPAIHVAGTNGKGSTCAMLEAMARAAGLRVGVTTSPHLARFAERIRVSGEPLEDEALAGVLERALATRVPLTFFEAAMVAAFLAFRDAEVDLAIVEVGLGGRLDATNVIPRPIASALVSVGLDHMAFLGDTLQRIAWDKAHVAKPGRPFVIGPDLAPEARAAALEVATARGARVVDAADVPPPPAHALALRGAHQVQNARVAVALAREAGIAEAAIDAGLRAAVWPGRFERLRTPAGPVLLDGAHNEAGMEALVRALDSEGLSPAATVFGAMADKAWDRTLGALAPVSGARVYVEPAGRKAVPCSDLAAAFPGEYAPSIPEALAAARRLAGPEGLVLVTGSLYLVGEARATLLGLPRDPPIAL